VGPALVVKKYPNRRLYDTEESRYITVDELTVRVRSGRDVRVVDARTDEDLTQATLVQVLLEGGRTHLLPTPLLMQLVRMGDDALAEFFGRWMTWALEVYFSVRQQAQSSWNPMAQVPFNMGSAFARMLMGGAGGMPGMAAGMTQGMSPTPPPVHMTPPPPEVGGDFAALRRELEELKSSLQPRGGALPRTRGARGRKQVKKR
jgi:polyhydroxyalkanoate synthesis repressor PhaR